jgi:hypothetical protein
VTTIRITVAGQYYGEVGYWNGIVRIGSGTEVSYRMPGHGLLTGSVRRQRPRHVR